MGKGYIYENGELVEVQDYSVDSAQEKRFCEHCKAFTWHVITAMSSTRGELWTCLQCGRES